MTKPPKRMRQHTQQAFLAALSATEGIMPRDLAKRLNLREQHSVAQLRRLRKLGLAERVAYVRPRGGISYLWFKADGYTPTTEAFAGPLYDPVLGFDIKALAACFNDYTFTKVVPTGGTLYVQSE